MKRVLNLGFPASVPLDERVSHIFRLAKGFIEVGREPMFLDKSVYPVPKEEAKKGLLARTKKEYRNLVEENFNWVYSGVEIVDVFEMTKYFLAPERLSRGYFTQAIDNKDLPEMLEVASENE